MGAPIVNFKDPPAHTKEMAELAIKVKHAGGVYNALVVDRTADEKWFKMTKAGLQVNLSPPIEACLKNETDLKNQIIRDAVLKTECNASLQRLGILLGAKHVRKPTLRALRAVTRCSPFFIMGEKSGHVHLVKPVTYTSIKLAARKERASLANTQKWLRRIVALGKVIQRERRERAEYEKAGSLMVARQWWHAMNLAVHNALVKEATGEDDPSLTSAIGARKAQKAAVRRILVSIGEDPRVGAEHGV